MIAKKGNVIECPNCGANIPVEGDREFFECAYCGAQVKNDSKPQTQEVEHIVVDEAAVLREQRLLQELELKRKEQEKKDKDDKAVGKFFAIFWLALLLLYFCVAVGPNLYYSIRSSIAQKNYKNTYTCPPAKNEKEFIGLNYEDVKESLRNITAAFTG